MAVFPPSRDHPAAGARGLNRPRASTWKSDLAAALDQVQAKLTGACLVADWFHGIGIPDPNRAMATRPLELRLGSSATDLAEYTAGKRAFVSAVLARSGIQLLPRKDA
jgi:hypothetical protein